MDAHNPRYADGSVVHVGDTVEFDKAAAADHSYAGYVSNMDSLVGLKLVVTKVGSTRFYRGSEVIILYLEALDDPSVQRTLDFFGLTLAACSSPLRSAMSTWRTRQDLPSFLRGCDRGQT